MAKFYYFIILFTIAIVNAGESETPSISCISKEQILNVGDKVDLECAVHHVEGYPVIWLRFDHSDSLLEMPLSINTTMIIRDSRLSVRFNEDASSFILSINNFQERDAGDYRCQIPTSLTKKIKAETKLAVKKN